MSLQNLLKIGRLEEHEASPAQLQRMLDGAARAIADAGVASVSPETRLDAAYRAITQLSMAALWANGFRPSRSQPGHHQLMIQTLVITVGLDPDQMALLDTFRVKRNVIDYTGADVDEHSVEACIEAARHLHTAVSEFLDRSPPE